LNPRIEILSETVLVGKSVQMSLADNKTIEVWRDFQMNKSAITNAVGTDLYSVQVYENALYFKEFNPQTEFTKWAAIEVAEIYNIPKGFASIVLPEGLYAVFRHIGLPSEFPKTMQFILEQWLPRSEYELDHRPHFELLGPNYKNNHPDSEEEVWIPIKKMTIVD